jgi:Saxitoxin biosynthesis operon protein SxtJ
MSWISDVRDELYHLRLSGKELKKFGLLVGSVFVVLSAIGIYRGWSIVGTGTLLLAGIVLLSCGMFLPESLKQAYRVWMAAAFAIGWLVSRLILLILFYFVLTPVGFLARIFEKEFLDTDFRKKKESYWIPKPANKKINYEKLF